MVGHLKIGFILAGKISPFVKKTKSKKKVPIDNPLSGKVSVKHYLNTKLKPRFDVDRMYPVYIQLVFNSKNAYIKSNFVKLLSNKVMFDGGFVFRDGPYMTEKEFSSGKYNKYLNEEARIISEIILFYGKYGVNILLSDTSEIIRSSLSQSIYRELSLHFWTRFYQVINEEIKSKKIDEDFLFLMLENKKDGDGLRITFDIGFKVLEKYGNKDVQNVLSKVRPQYEMFQLLKNENNFLIYEWVFKDLKNYYGTKYSRYPNFLSNIRETIISYFNYIIDFFPDGSHSMLDKIKRDI
jgi:hypothetical protein